MFGRKPGSKKTNNKKNVNLNKENTSDELEIESESENKSNLNSFESSFDNSLFYTSDKILSQMDDKQIIAFIIKQYPDFNYNISKDTVLKKTLISIINDVEFVKKVLSKFDLNILDLFKVLYKYYSSIFTPLYIKKVKLAISRKSYARKSNWSRTDKKWL